MDKHTKNPHKYIYNEGNSFISLGYIGEKQVVIGCPCNLISEYEQLFWSSRNIIKKYFLAKAEKKDGNCRKRKRISERCK